MKRKTPTVVLSLVLALVFAFTFTACSGGDANRITLDKNHLYMTVGEEYTITATCDPTDAAKDLTWSSDNASVATVTNGTVKAIKSGNATVKAKAKNGVMAYCNVTVKEEWQYALENTCKQTDYTVTMVEDLGMGYDDNGTVKEMFGLDVTHTDKLSLTSKLFSAKEVTAMTQNGESLGSMTDRVYAELDGTNVYSYDAYNYGTANAVWREHDVYVDSSTPEANFCEMAASYAFDILLRSYGVSDGYGTQLAEMTEGVVYDSSAKKLTVSGLVTEWLFMSPGGGHMNKEFDAALEVTFENNLVKTYKLSLSRNYGYAEIFGGEPSAEEPGTLILSGEVTGTVTYGNTQVTVSSADRAAIDRVKANRPLLKAFNALDGYELNFTMTAQAGAKNMGVAKYSLTKEGGVYSLEGGYATPEYITVEGDGENDAITTKYYKDGSRWFKRSTDSYSVYGTAAEESVAKRFFVGDKTDPGYGNTLTTETMYGSFTAGADNTYTATFVDYYGSYDYDQGNSVYIFADCAVTVKLNENGALSSVEYDYGSKADGEHFVNLKYTFTAYGTTHATVPQDIIDNAKEVGSGEDSVITQAFEKFSQNTENVTVVRHREYTATPQNNETVTMTTDVANGHKKYVEEYAEYTSTRYYGLGQENGTWYTYDYIHYDGPVWIYYKNRAGNDYDSALNDFARIDFNSYRYAVAEGGDSTNLQYLGWAFDGSDGVYTADLYILSWNDTAGSDDYLTCTVTIRLDGKGRITSIKAESSDGVEEHIITYGTATVAFPAGVSSAKENINQDDSAVWNAFEKLNENADSIIVEYTVTDHNNAENNGAGSTKVDVTNKIREDVTDGRTSYQRLVEESGEWYLYQYRQTGEDWTCYKEQITMDEYAMQNFAHLYLDMTEWYKIAEDSEYSRRLAELYLIYDQTSNNTYMASLYYEMDVYAEDGTQSTVYVPCNVTIQLDGEGRISTLTVALLNTETCNKTYVYEFTYGNATVTIPDDVLATQPQ